MAAHDCDGAPLGRLIRRQGLQGDFQRPKGDGQHRQGTLPVIRSHSFKVDFD